MMSVFFAALRARLERYFPDLFEGLQHLADGRIRFGNEISIGSEAGAPGKGRGRKDRCVR